MGIKKERTVAFGDKGKTNQKTPRPHVLYG